MTFLFIEPFSGASGDMILGALLDLGVPVADVEAALKTLPIRGWSLAAERTSRKSIAATKARVRLDALHGGEEGYATADLHRHHGHAHRTPGEIFEIIRTSALPERVKQRSEEVFAALAAAEARVHGTTPDAVHFHEVGAVDAIVDICGSVFAFERLGVDRVFCAAATTGFGMVRCAHGVVPAPAPATVFLMEGRPVRQGPVEGELLTPTGAALLSVLVTDWGPPPPYVARRAGFGAGNSDWEQLANVLRMTLCDPAGGAATDASRIREAEFEVDDMTGGELGFLREALRAAGVLDVSIAAVMMKKERPGHRVLVLFQADREEAVERIIFSRSSTFGFRVRSVERRMLDREIVTVTTPIGACRVKVGRHRGEIVQVRPEYEDVAALARSSGAPMHEIEAAAIAAYRNRT